MKSQVLVFQILLALTVLAQTASAQHEGHSAGSAQANVDASRCIQAQPVVNQILTGAAARLEAARQTNSPAQMRAAIDDLQDALRDLRAQLAPCAELAPTPPAADPHAGHSMGQTSSGKPKS